MRHGKKQFNGGGLLRAVANTLDRMFSHWIMPLIYAIAIPSAFVGGVIYIILADVKKNQGEIKKEEERIQLIEQFNKEAGIETFKITGDHSLTVTVDGGLTKYDFFQEQVRIGEKGYLFDDYPSKTIETVQSNMCKTYLPEFFSALDDFETVNGFEHPDFDEAGEMKYTQNFINTYCSKGI